jgi:hypothetical protein
MVCDLWFRVQDVPGPLAPQRIRAEIVRYVLRIQGVGCRVRV